MSLYKNIFYFSENQAFMVQTIQMFNVISPRLELIDLCDIEILKQSKTIHLSRNVTIRGRDENPKQIIDFLKIFTQLYSLCMIDVSIKRDILAEICKKKSLEKVFFANFYGELPGTNFYFNHPNKKLKLCIPISKARNISIDDLINVSEMYGNYEYCFRGLLSKILEKKEDPIHYQRNNIFEIPLYSENCPCATKFPCLKKDLYCDNCLEISKIERNKYFGCFPEKEDFDEEKILALLCDFTKYLAPVPSNDLEMINFISERYKNSPYYEMIYYSGNYGFVDFLISEVITLWIIWEYEDEENDSITSIKNFCEFYKTNNKREIEYQVLMFYSSLIERVKKEDIPKFSEIIKPILHIFVRHGKKIENMCEIYDQYENLMKTPSFIYDYMDSVYRLDRYMEDYFLDRLNNEKGNKKIIEIYYDRMAGGVNPYLSILLDLGLDQDKLETTDYLLNSGSIFERDFKIPADVVYRSFSCSHPDICKLFYERRAEPVDNRIILKIINGRKNKDGFEFITKEIYEDSIKK